MEFILKLVLIQNLLFFSFFAKSQPSRPEINPRDYAPECLVDRKIFLELKGADLVNYMEQYCSFFHANQENDYSDFYCVTKKKDGEPEYLCKYSKKSNPLIMRIIPSFSDFDYRSPKSLVPVLKSLSDSIEKFSSKDKISKINSFIEKFFPLNYWLDLLPSGEIIGNHFKQNKPLGTFGFLCSNTEYINFLNSNLPFKMLLDNPPGFLEKQDFWISFQKIYVLIKDIKDPEKKQKIMEKELKKIENSIIHPYFKKRKITYQLYPIVSIINFTNDGYRIFLYYEEKINGKIWGRNFILPLMGGGISKEVLVTQANYDLDSSAKRQSSFLYEDKYFFQKDGSFSKKSRWEHTEMTENCMVCHIEINKIKIGKAELNPRTNGDFYKDYLAAFYQSNPLAGNLKIGNNMKFDGKTFRFPEILYSENNESGEQNKIRLLDYNAFSPSVGSNNTPHVNVCFKSKAELVAKRSRNIEFDQTKFEKSINCYTCHNENEFKFGAINSLHFSANKGIDLMVSQMEEYNKIHSKLGQKLYREIFMPYGHAKTSNHENENENMEDGLSLSESIELINCIKESYPTDYFNWLNGLLETYIRDLENY